MLNRLWPFCSMYLKNDPTLWVCTFDREEPSLIEILKDDGERDSIGKLMVFCSVFAQELQHENIVALYDVQVSHYWWFSSLVENEGVNNVSPTFTTLGGGPSVYIYKKKRLLLRISGGQNIWFCVFERWPFPAFISGLMPGMLFVAGLLVLHWRHALLEIVGGIFEQVMIGSWVLRVSSCASSFCVFCVIAFACLFSVKIDFATL